MKYIYMDLFAEWGLRFRYSDEFICVISYITTAFVRQYASFVLVWFVTVVVYFANL